MNELETLHCVQGLDTRIFELRSLLERHPLAEELRDLEETEAEALAQVEAAERLLEESKARQARVEAELQSLEDKLRREEERLYGGSVASPKELRGLEAEVRSLKRKKDALETEELEEMERLDELKANLDGSSASRDRLRARIEEKRKALEGELDAVRSEIETLEREKEELRSQIGGELLELYDRLLASKNRLAVAKVEDGVCRGCRVELPGKDYDRFLKSQGPFLCTNCGRILVK